MPSYRWSHFLKSFLNSSRKPSRPGLGRGSIAGSKRLRATYYPRLEMLEGRIAPAMVPLTVTVTGVGLLGPGTANFYAAVTINGVTQNTPQSGPNNSSIFVDWPITQMVDSNSPAVVSINLFDAGDGQIDINPGAGNKTINVKVDPLTGFFIGDLNWPSTLSNGGGGDGRTGDLAFTTSSNGISSFQDKDGDGLPDLWEINGLDTDTNRADGVELPLNTWGANPNHKDLFLELDWMAGAAPTREVINTLKDAFAVAPIDAGTDASALTGGMGVPGEDAQPNPDGKPGINLHVDTGSLKDSTGQLVGDNLGGGNLVPTLNVSNLNANFYSLKASNFNPNRALVFRYGIRTTTPTNLTGTSTGGNTTTTLNDTTQTWVPTEWAGYSVLITGGTGFGQPANPITANTATQLTLTNAWTTTPDNTTTYSISRSANNPGGWASGGWSEIGGNDLMVFNSDAGSLMHELGHSLDLQHGGFQGVNFKSNYVSDMNYYYQFGIPTDSGTFINDYSPALLSVGGTTNGGNTATTFNDNTQNWTPNQWAGGYVNVIDNGAPEVRLIVSNTATTLVVAQAWSTIPVANDAYSLYTASPARANPTPATLTESALLETTVVDPTDTSNRMVFTNSAGTVVSYPLNGIDRNGDGTIDGPDYNNNGLVDTAAVAVNIDGATGMPPPPPKTTPFVGQNDWQRISLPFRQFGDSAYWRDQRRAGPRADARRLPAILRRAEHHRPYPHCHAIAQPHQSGVRFDLHLHGLDQRGEPRRWCHRRGHLALRCGLRLGQNIPGHCGLRRRHGNLEAGHHQSRRSGHSPPRCHPLPRRQHDQHRHRGDHQQRLGSWEQRRRAVGDGPQCAAPYHVHRAIGELDQRKRHDHAYRELHGPRQARHPHRPD